MGAHTHLPCVRAQVEHHVWPSLSMLSYQRSQPELAAICARHGVPYVQESVFTRLWKTLDIMVGRASMRPFTDGAALGAC